MDNEKRVSKKRPGRTLLVTNVPSSVELKYNGLVDLHRTENGSNFLVFDNVESATQAFSEISESGFQVKYSYYKVFFRLRDCDLETLEYDKMKDSIKKALTTLNSNINIVYFKFYTKNNKLIGSGDFTLDTKEDLDSLVELRELDVEVDGSQKKVSVYRFRMRRRQPHANNNTV